MSDTKPSKFVYTEALPIVTAEELEALGVLPIPPPIPPPKAPSDDE